MSAHLTGTQLSLLPLLYPGSELKRLSKANFEGFTESAAQPFFGPFASDRQPAAQCRLMADNAPDNWITIAEAVGRTGKSERTLRRWVADNRLSTRRESGRVLVNLADLAEIEPAAAAAAPDITGAPATPAEVARLQAEVARLQALLQAVESERDYLRQMLAAALGGQQRLIEAQASRPRWWWPWQRQKPGE